MIEWISNWFLMFNFTGRMGVMLFWVPMTLCAYGYITRTFQNYRKCCEARDSDKYFQSDTIGTIIGRTIVTVMPILNLLAAIFDLGPMIFSKFFIMIGQAFDIPLVRKK